MIYFAQSEATGSIKIGHTRDIRKRLSALSCGNPESLILLASCPGNFLLEQQFHQQFKDSRERGEWFFSDVELRELIRNINAGPVDDKSFDGWWSLYRSFLPLVTWESWYWIRRMWEDDNSALIPSVHPDLQHSLVARPQRVGKRTWAWPADTR